MDPRLCKDLNSQGPSKVQALAVFVWGFGFISHGHFRQNKGCLGIELILLSKIEHVNQGAALEYKIWGTQMVQSQTPKIRTWGINETILRESKYHTSIFNRLPWRERGIPVLSIGECTVGVSLLQAYRHGRCLHWVWVSLGLSCMIMGRFTIWVHLGFILLFFWCTFGVYTLYRAQRTFRCFFPT